MVLFGVYRGRAGSTVAMCDENETIAWWPCTSQSNLEMFSEKISASTCSGKEIGMTEEK